MVSFGKPEKKLGKTGKTSPNIPWRNAPKETIPEWTGENIFLRLSVCHDPKRAPSPEAGADLAFQRPAGLFPDPLLNLVDVGREQKSLNFSS